MNFGKLQALAATVGRNSGDVLEVIGEVLKKCEVTQILETKDGQQICITLMIDSPPGNRRYERYLSFDVYAGKQRVGAVECNPNLADFDEDAFRKLLLLASSAVHLQTQTKAMPKF